MTSQIAAYTPLESLLLFQALRNGVELSSFTRISEDLQKVPLVRDDPTYDATRLSPDALRQLYLDLLKGEARQDVQRLTNGDALSRKRKAPSPKLPSVHEAAQHSHLIPQLITRLYTRYREITVGRIREQEARYDALARDISDLRSGKLDKTLEPVPTTPGYALQRNRPIQPQPSTLPRPAPLRQVSMADVLRALATPPRNVRQPVWKSEDSQGPEAPGSPKRPQVELLSPVLARAPSPPRRRTRRKDDSESVASDRIKHESTPFIADSEEPEQVPSMVTRKRRGTLQTQTSFRRRTQDEPPPRPTTVLATRNFAKMSSVIMNEVVSHKHGSRFAQPVREKDADGYSAFIKRPQDLKSIRAAITHGARVIAAADSESTPGKAQENVVELERTVDLIPPKAIVNGAQLEKEIMRMFANAVMFNPGEDGMVADTREMFEDVEAKIADWRGAERDAEPEEEDEGRAKRRKL